MRKVDKVYECVDLNCQISGKISLNLPIQWCGPLHKNDANDEKAKQLCTQFNVSYNP